MWIERERHDEIISITSHIPHLISSALVGIAKDDNQINEIMGMAAGGFDGATSLTRTTPEMIIDNLCSMAEIAIKSIDWDGKKEVHNVVTSLENYIDSASDKRK